MRWKPRAWQVLLVLLCSCSRLLVLGDELRLGETGAVGRVREVASFVPSSVDAVDSVRLGPTATASAFLGDGGLTVVVDAPAALVAGASSGPARAVALTEAPTLTAWVATPNGLETFGLNDAGALVERATVALPFEPATVRRLASTRVTAWNAARLAVVHADAGVFVSPLFAGELFDVVELEAGLAFPDGGQAGAPVLVALTSSGGFATPLDAPDVWHAVAFEKSGSRVLRRLVVEAPGPRLLGLTVAPAGDAVALGVAGPAPNHEHTWLAMSGGDVLQVTQVARPPCIQAEALVAGQGPNEWQLFCRAPDGGLLFATSMAVDVLEPLEAGLTAVSPDGRLVAGAGQALRFDATGALVPLTPAFDRLRSVLGRASRAVLMFDGVDAGLPTTPSVCATRATPWFWCTEGGAPALPVRGRPEWGVDSAVTAWDLESGRQTARVGDAALGASSAWFLDETLFVAAGRELFRGLPPAPVTTLTVGPITSLSARSSQALSAIADGRVFEVSDDGGWSARPLEWTDAVFTWNDGARGRVLFRDGSVRLLPTGEQVVAPTSERFFTAESYCGQTFALSTSGLSRLVVSDTGAAWEPIELGAVPPSSLVNGRLLAEERALLVLLPGQAPRLLDGFDCAD